MAAHFYKKLYGAYGSYLLCLFWNGSTFIKYKLSSAGLPLEVKGLISKVSTIREVW